MGSFCSRNNAVVVPMSSDIPIADNFNTELTNTIKIVWLGKANITCLSVLRRNYGRHVHAFETVSQSINFINSTENSIRKCIFVINYDAENTAILKPIIDQIGSLKQICAIYIYHEDKSIPSNYRSICTVSNINHLHEQIRMVIQQSNVTSIADRSIADTIRLDEENIHIVIYENSLNQLLRSVQEFKFFRDNKQVIDDNGRIITKDKRKNFIWKVEFIVSDMEISFKEADDKTPCNTVEFNFIAMVKGTVTSINIPIGISNFEREPNLTRESKMEGAAFIEFKPEGNIFQMKITKAIIDIDLKLFQIKDLDVAELMPTLELPGPINLSQPVRIPIQYTTNTDDVRLATISINEFRMSCQGNRLILSMKVNYEKITSKIVS